VTAALPIAGSNRWQIARADLGMMPFLASLPFLYVPKLLEGDTQPWVLLTAVFALFTYRPRSFLQRSDVLLVALVLLSIGIYVARAGVSGLTVRMAYILLMFLVLWALARRGGENLFAMGVRFTLTIWFIAGLYQYIAVKLGLPMDFGGRYVEGRGGVPSMTAEPSYFGTLSVLMVMYLLHFGGRNGIYIAMAVLSVLMSGSILAVIFLIFPFLYLRMPVKILAAGAVTALVLVDAAINEAGLTARLAGFGSAGEGLVSLLVDPSLNTRFGHIWFSLWDNLWAELTFTSAIGFQNAYNTFAAETGVLIPTESEFILPIAGELLFGIGIFGLLIAGLLVSSAMRSGRTRGEQLIRGGLVVACLLNPISIANPFLVFLALQEKSWQPRS
jgi:hypothetical protein